LNLRNGAGSLVMMPIGVPKVAYRERIIFLGQEIDDDYANQIIGVLLVGGLV
jgi:hypothetical protein